MKPYRAGSNLEFVYEKIRDIQPGNIFMFSDFSRIDYYTFRMAISKIASDMGRSFKTRYDKNRKVLNIERIR